MTPVVQGHVGRRAYGAKTTLAYRLSHSPEPLL